MSHLDYFYLFIVHSSSLYHEIYLYMLIDQSLFLGLQNTHSDEQKRNFEGKGIIPICKWIDGNDLMKQPPC